MAAVGWEAYEGCTDVAKQDRRQVDEQFMQHGWHK